MLYQKRQASACSVPLIASTAIKTITVSHAQSIHSMLVEYVLAAPLAVIHAQMSPVAPNAVLDTSWPLLSAALALRDAVLARSAQATSARAASVDTI